MSDVTVKAYHRKDGTAVRSHSRRWLWKRKEKEQKKHVSSLENLTVTDPKEFSPTLDYAEVVDYAKYYFKNKQWGGLRGVYNRSHDFSYYESPPWGLILFGSTFMGGLLMLMGVTVLGGVIAAPGLLAALVSAWRGINSSRYSKATKKKFGKFLSESEKDKRPNLPTPEKLDDIMKQYDWKSTPAHSDSESIENGRSSSEVMESGWAKVSWNKHTQTFGLDPIIARGEHYFYPHAQLQGKSFLIDMYLDEVNMEGANLSNSFFENVAFRNANLKNVNFEGGDIRGSMEGAILEGANFKNAHLAWCDLSGCDLIKANLDGAIMPKDLTGIKLTRSQAETILDNSKEVKDYEKFTFDEAIGKLSITPQQFEFLVLSGSIRVRNGITQKNITQDFDPNRDYVPMWEIEEVERSLAIPANSAGDS